MREKEAAQNKFFDSIYSLQKNKRNSKKNKILKKKLDPDALPVLLALGNKAARR